MPHPTQNLNSDEPGCLVPQYVQNIGAADRGESAALAGPVVEAGDAGNEGLLTWDKGGVTERDADEVSDLVAVDADGDPNTGLRATAGPTAGAAGLLNTAGGGTVLRTPQIIAHTGTCWLARTHDGNDKLSSAHRDTVGAEAEGSGALAAAGGAPSLEWVLGGGADTLSSSSSSAWCLRHNPFGSASSPHDDTPQNRAITVPAAQPVPLRSVKVCITECSLPRTGRLRRRLPARHRHVRRGTGGCRWRRRGIPSTTRRSLALQRRDLAGHSGAHHCLLLLLRNAAEPWSGEPSGRQVHQDQHNQEVSDAKCITERITSEITYRARSARCCHTGAPHPSQNTP